MSTVITLVRSNFRMLLRQRGLIISSLGLAVISMVIFGGLFGSNSGTKTQLGVVDQDHSSASTQIARQLQHTNSLTVYSGTYDEEQQALKDGNRNAIIVLSAGFAEKLTKGTAHIAVFYNQGDPITEASTQLTVQAIVEGLNRTATHQPGPVTLDQQGVAVKTLREIDYITPGLLGMLLMWANLVVGTQFVLWREKGITRRLAATPLPPIAMIGSQIAARLLLSLAQAAMLLTLAVLVFNVHIYGNLWLLGLMVTLGALTMLAIGSAIGSFVKKSEAGQAIILLVSFPMMFLGGTYFPVNNAPSIMQPLIHAMPLYYLNDALRQITWNGAGWLAIQTSVLILLAWIVASLLITWRTFKWL